MQLKQLLNDDDAVSPVIGVILMVAITVILAAVIATFVLGLGEQVSQTSPNTSFSFDYDENVSPDDSWGTNANNADALLTITHSGGPNLDADQVGVVGFSADVSKGSPVYDDFSMSNEGWASDEMSAGDGVDVYVANGDRISVVWENEEGDESATLQRFQVPE